MSDVRPLVLDANILIRAVLGKRVYPLMRAYASSIDFRTPGVCFEKARVYLPRLLSQRGEDPGTGLAFLDRVSLLVGQMDEADYRGFEQLARELMAPRDLEDWPIAAIALLLNAPIWTEDQDFFGCGIPTWTTDRVEIYLEGRYAEVLS